MVRVSTITVKRLLILITLSIFCQIYPTIFCGCQCLFNKHLHKKVAYFHVYVSMCMLQKYIRSAGICSLSLITTCENYYICMCHTILLTIQSHVHTYTHTHLWINRGDLISTHKLTFVYYVWVYVYLCVWRWKSTHLTIL